MFLGVTLDSSIVSVEEQKVIRGNLHKHSLLMLNEKFMLIVGSFYK